MLSERSLRQFDEAIRRLYVHADLDRYPQRLLEAISPLIGSEVTCYTELMPSEQRVRNFADRHDDQLESLLPVLAEFQLQHPHIVDYVETGQPSPRTTGDYLSRKEWHKLDLFQHFYRVMGLEDHLVVMMPAAGGAHLGIVYNRTSRSFSSEHREILDRLRPHIALSYSNALAVTRSAPTSPQTTPKGERVHGVVRLRGDGAPWFHTRRARELFDLRWPASSKRFSWSLPSPVEDWVRHEIRRSTRRDGSSVGRRVVELPVRGGMVTLRLAQEPSGSGWTLLVEERSEGALHLATIGLPARLRRMLEQLLTGRSEKEISEHLSLSPHTVHEYTKQLYRQFGVSSRPELMAKFVIS